MRTNCISSIGSVALSRRNLGLLAVSTVAVRSLERASVATPVASPMASPIGSPVASPMASPVAIDFDALLAQALEAGIPGLAMAVSKDGELLYSGAAGVSNLETQKAVEPDDRFRIYSIAKAFAATVVLQLVDEGVLSLDDTVTKWLDTDAVLAIPNIDQVTIRQLLNHTSGIYDFADDTDSPFWEDAFLVRMRTGPKSGRSMSC